MEFIHQRRRRLGAHEVAAREPEARQIELVHLDERLVDLDGQVQHGAGVAREADDADVGVVEGLLRGAQPRHDLGVLRQLLRFLRARQTHRCQGPQHAGLEGLVDAEACRQAQRAQEIRVGRGGR